MDDAGVLPRTLGEVLTREGVELRPGSLDQVAGAAPGWAIATLLEGHGRSDLEARRGELEQDVVRRWAELARSGGIRPRPEAVPLLEAVWGVRPVAILTGLPAAVAGPLAEVAFGARASEAVLAADGVDGLPRPDRLMTWLDATCAGDRDVTAFLGSAAALLAAIGARIDDVVLVGAGSPAAAMLAERSVPDLAAGLAS
jgi:hypothetical protein